MKQFKATRLTQTSEVALALNIDNLITQHNALVDYLEEQEKEENGIRTIEVGQLSYLIPKPEWWEVMPHCQQNYLEALEACSKASGILFELDI